MHHANSADKAFAGAFLFHGKNFFSFFEKEFFLSRCCQGLYDIM
jgi:hypothetical protein